LDIPPQYIRIFLTISIIVIMKIVSKIVKSSLLVALLATSACDKFTDFGDVNLSPNSPSVASTASLLTGAITQVGGVATAINPCLYTQQFGDVTYIEESRYKTVFFDYAGFYTTPLNSLNYIIKLNTDAATKDAAAANGSNANQIAIARILKAFFFLNITDRWGDAPYSQALKGKDNFSPAFDTQQAIYNDLFKELKEAQAQFDAGSTVKGDILLSGNTTRWKKFANSLRAVMALRLSKVDPAKGKTELAAALADGVITANTENVTYKYLKDANYESPLYNNYVTGNRKDFAVSNVMIDYLVKTSDPRIAAFADKATATLTYKGVPYGVFPPASKAQDVSLASSTKIANQDAAVNITTYAQILFTQAEAAKLGWIAGDAKKLYEDAVKASMQQWGVYTTDPAFATYISGADVAYTDAKALELIGTQKWVALFYMGYEAWAEWRRTGFPALTPAAKPLNVSGQIPRRMAYPTTEATLNKANYDEVVKRQGADTQDTRVWWDKK
jgi:Starch-binding associating with outer membrane